MKLYFKPEMDVKEIVAIEYINNDNQDGYDSWLEEEGLDGVTTFNLLSLFK